MTIFIVLSGPDYLTVFVLPSFDVKNKSSCVSKISKATIAAALEGGDELT